MTDFLSHPHTHDRFVFSSGGPHFFTCLQITEALSYLHGIEQIIHRNVCPQSVLVTRRGNWKLAGLGFAERVREGKVNGPFMFVSVGNIYIFCVEQVLIC